MLSLSETLFTSVKEHQTITTHNNNRHCHVHFYACVRIYLSKPLYIKQERQCFIGISEHPEETWKYDTQWSILDEIRGVWIADETLSQVFDMSSHSKKKN